MPETKTKLERQLDLVLNSKNPKLAKFLFGERALPLLEVIKQLRKQKTSPEQTNQKGKPS